jgi:nucleotide-binding universal stress UspA family protein
MTKTQERSKAEIVIRPNTYATLLVHAEPGLGASKRTEAAARLAHDLGAHLIGLGAETFEPIATPDPFTGYAAGEWIAMIQGEIAKNLAAAETAFRRDAAGADFEWRSVEDYPSRALANLARAADLIVMSPRGPGGPTRTADPAEVVMAAGRPILIVPQGREHLRATSVVVAWKDTRECARAMSDAMPFLQRAEDVVVLAICSKDAADSAVFATDDVVANLKRHGVNARAQVVTAPGSQVTAEINRIASLNNADLVVAGAYGHSRVREWVLGGVTDDMVHRPETFVLLSH